MSIEDLWKPATDINPEELIGKHLKLSDGRIVVFYRDGDAEDEIVVTDINSMTRLYVSPDSVFYLDDSKEAVDEMMKAYMKDADELIEGLRKQIEDSAEIEVDKRMIIDRQYPEDDRYYESDPNEDLPF